MLLPEDVRAPDDAFGCTRLQTKLTASACIGRQRYADPEMRKNLSPGERVASGRAETYGTCRSCPVGKSVRLQVEGTT